MSVLTAARAVLEATSEPLTADEIYGRMVERGLWENPHESPEDVVHAALSSSIGRDGENSPFRMVGDRRFELRSTSG